MWVDLAGPEAIPSTNGYLYLMNLIDDSSGYVWTILFKYKHDAFPSLKAWIFCVENETGLKLGQLCCNGGELDSLATQDWCLANGYSITFTAPYTSAHIGHVEHMYHTI